MKRNIWLRTRAATLARCALPLTGALAANGRRGAAQAGQAGTADALVLSVLAEGGTSPLTEAEYGGTIILQAQKSDGTNFAAGESVVFSVPGKAAGDTPTELGKVTVDIEAAVVQLPYDTAQKGLAIGENTITAVYAPAGTLPAPIAGAGGAGDAAQTPAAQLQGEYALTLDPKPLKLQLGAFTYNATTRFEIQAPVLEGIIQGDDVSAPQLALITADKHVGEKTFYLEAVSPTARRRVKDAADPPKPGAVIQLQGTAAGYYTLPASGGEQKVTIQPAPITFTAALQEKTYDGTTAAQIDTVTYTAQTGDTLQAGVDYTVTAQFGQKDAAYTPDGELAAVPATVTVALLDTEAAQNYVLAQDDSRFTTQGYIQPAPLTVTLVNVDSKVYDGAASLTVTSTVALQGAAAGDGLQEGTDYTIRTEFADPNAGENKEIKATLESLGTAKMKNYQLPAGPLTLSSPKGIGPRDIADAAIQLELLLPDTGYVQDGSAKTPQVKITDTGLAGGTPVVLAQAKDYTLTYENNTNAGTATVVVTGKGNYKGERRVQFTIAPPPAPTQTPAREWTPGPTPTPQPFDWYPALGSIQSVQTGKVTIDAAGEVAVPHFIWQAFYGKDITVTITRGSDKFVFNGLDLKASGFDPDTGHNLTDLTGYIGRSYDKPAATPTPKPTASPAPTPQPTAKPTATPAPTAAPATATPAPSAQPAQGGAAGGWLYWVIGIAAVLVLALAGVLVWLRRRGGSDPYGYDQ